MPSYAVPSLIVAKIPAHYSHGQGLRFVGTGRGTTPYAGQGTYFFCNHVVQVVAKLS